jgi:pyridoxine 5'-phosphate synthase PdxJ
MDKVINLVTLTKFRDGSWMWSKDNVTHFPASESEVIASGRWLYRIEQKEVEMVLNTLKYRGHDVALFRDGYWLETYPIDYTKMNEENAE